MEKGYKEKEGKNTLELDWTFIKHMGERMQANKGEYEPYNWKKPMEDPRELLTAAQRHLIALHEGILEDDRRPYGHIEGAACNLMMYFAQMVIGNREKFKIDFMKSLANQPLRFVDDTTIPYPIQEKNSIEFARPETGYCTNEENIASMRSIPPVHYEHLESGIYKVVFKKRKTDVLNIKRNDEGVLVFNYIRSSDESWYPISNYIDQIKNLIKIEIK